MNRIHQIRSSLFFSDWPLDCVCAQQKGAADALTTAVPMGELHWRYVTDLQTAQWEDGGTYQTVIGFGFERRAIPSGVYRTVSHPHELRAFVSRSRTLPIGAMSVTAISTGRDMVADYRFTGDQREHGAYFNRPIQYTYCFPPGAVPGDAYNDELTLSSAFHVPLYRQLLQDIGISGAVTP